MYGMVSKMVNFHKIKKLNYMKVNNKFDKCVFFLKKIKILINVHFLRLKGRVGL